MIQIEKVNFFYGIQKALNNINLSVPQHSVMAFIGPSGCGKSTLLRLINRMNDLIDGTKMEGLITVDGMNIYDKKIDIETLRKNVGMVFQKPNPFPKTIFENVAYGLRVSGMSNATELKDRVENALIQAALWKEVEPVLHKNATNLSGGQQQRLCIARCLAVNPKIILMDEPASALDPISTSKIEELILELKLNHTIVIVTHNMQQALRVSDYTSFFYLGELIECNTTSEIFNNPKQDKTRNYVTGKFG
ncbi:MAG: phosphate ABC transporter ATP-binding protein [Chitinophagaceae bacterium]|nr:phosphate ABC transporter ATP-binding protein [Chitinophagaceae bacterium]